MDSSLGPRCRLDGRLGKQLGRNQDNINLQNKNDMTRVLSMGDDPANGLTHADRNISFHGNTGKDPYAIGINTAAGKKIGPDGRAHSSDMSYATHQASDNKGHYIGHDIGHDFKKIQDRKYNQTDPKKLATQRNPDKITSAIFDSIPLPGAKGGGEVTGRDSIAGIIKYESDDKNAAYYYAQSMVPNWSPRRINEAIAGIPCDYQSPHRRQNIHTQSPRSPAGPGSKDTRNEKTQNCSKDSAAYYCGNTYVGSQYVGHGKTHHYRDGDRSKDQRSVSREGKLQQGSPNTLPIFEPLSSIQSPPLTQIPKPAKQSTGGTGDQTKPKAGDRAHPEAGLHREDYYQDNEAVQHAIADADFLEDESAQKQANAQNGKKEWERASLVQFQDAAQQAVQGDATQQSLSGSVPTRGGYDPTSEGYPSANAVPANAGYGANLSGANAAHDSGRNYSSNMHITYGGSAPSRQRDNSPARDPDYVHVSKNQIGGNQPRSPRIFDPHNTKQSPRGIHDSYRATNQKPSIPEAQSKTVGRTFWPDLGQEPRHNHPTCQQKKELQENRFYHDTVGKRQVIKNGEVMSHNTSGVNDKDFEDGIFRNVPIKGRSHGVMRHEEIQAFRENNRFAGEPRAEHGRY